MSEVNNPSSYKFKPASNPAVVGYQTVLRVQVDGSLVGSIDTDLAHLPPLDGAGFYVLSCDGLKALAKANGKEGIGLTIGVEADYPGGQESVEVDAPDSVVFVSLDPPTDVEVVS